MRSCRTYIANFDRRWLSVHKRSPFKTRRWRIFWSTRFFKTKRIMCTTKTAALSFSSRRIWSWNRWAKKRSTSSRFSTSARRTKNLSRSYWSGKDSSGTLRRNTRRLIPPAIKIPGTTLKRKGMRARRCGQTNCRGRGNWRPTLRGSNNFSPTIIQRKWGPSWPTCRISSTSSRRKSSSNPPESTRTAASSARIWTKLRSWEVPSQLTHARWSWSKHTSQTQTRWATRITLCQKISWAGPESRKHICPWTSSISRTRPPKQVVQTHPRISWKNKTRFDQTVSWFLYLCLVSLPVYIDGSRPFNQLQAFLHNILWMTKSKKIVDYLLLDAL